MIALKPAVGNVSGSVLGYAERLERAEEIGVLVARHHADEATEAKPGSKRVGASERCAQQHQKLDFGRLLHVHEVKFRFVVPTMRKGDDYDFEVIYPDGLAVPADAKCKFETTKINPGSVAIP
jgi:hypothetical protein